MLVACGGRALVIPANPRDAVVGYPKKSHFQLFKFGRTGAGVAIAAGPNAELWFSDCKEAAKGPCRIGFFDRSLRETLVPGKFPFIQDLALGPDGNMWFDEGFFYPIPHYLGKVTRSLKVHLYRIHGWAKGIVGGPDGRMWFDYSGGLASISTDGRALRRTKYRVADWNRAGVVMFFGPDKRLYFQESTDTKGYPVCALAVFWKKLQCYRDPRSTAAAIPLLFAGPKLLVQNAYTHRVYGLSMRGPRIDIKGGHAFYPLAFTSNGKLIVESLDPNNPNTGITVTRLLNDAFLPGTYYSLTYRQTQQQSYNYDRGVTTTDGYVWLHSGVGGCLTRFSIRE